MVEALLPGTFLRGYFSGRRIQDDRTGAAGDTVSVLKCNKVLVSESTDHPADSYSMHALTLVGVSVQIGLNELVDHLN